MNYSQSKNILIDKYKCVYYIIPKNGCSSIKSKLVDILQLKKGANFPVDIHDQLVYPFPFVMPNNLHHLNSSHLIFAIARNPWDRLVSCFKDKIRPLDFNGDGFINGVAIPLKKNSDLFYGGMSFEAFVDVICSIPDHLGEHHFTSQLYQMTDETGNLLVNYIGRLETINEDLKKISDDSGLPLTDISHLHKSNRKPYQVYYNKTLIDKVHNRFYADVNFFNYTFTQNSNLSKIGYVNEKLREDAVTIQQARVSFQDKNQSLSKKLMSPFRSFRHLLSFKKK